MRGRPAEAGPLRDPDAAAHGRADEGASRRIWLALDTACSAAGALSAAAALAGWARAELAGLFVEDENLLRLASLPAAVEMHPFAPEARPLDPRAMEQALRAQATVAQRRMAAVASTAGLAWSFRTARGRTVEQALAMSASTEIVVLGGGAPSFSVPAEGASRPGAALAEIWMLPAGGADLERLVDLARRLAQGADGGVTLVASETGEGRTRELAQAAGLAARSASMEDLLARPGRAAARRLVLASRPSGPEQLARLVALLRRLRDPLALA